MDFYTDTPYMRQYRNALRNRFVNSLAAHEIQLDAHPISVEIHEHVVKALAEYVSALIVAVKRPVRFPVVTVIQWDRPLTISVSQTIAESEDKMNPMPFVFTVSDKDGIVMCAEVTDKYPQFELLRYAIELAMMEPRPYGYVPQPIPGYMQNPMVDHNAPWNRPPMSQYGGQHPHHGGFGQYNAPSPQPMYQPNGGYPLSAEERMLQPFDRMSQPFGPGAPYVPRSGTEMYAPTVEIRRFYDAPVIAMAEATAEDSELDNIIPFHDSQYAVMVIGKHDTARKMVLVVDTYTVSPNQLLSTFTEKHKVNHPTLDVSALLDHVIAQDGLTLEGIDLDAVEDTVDFELLVTTMLNHVSPSESLTYFLVTHPERTVDAMAAANQ